MQVNLELGNAADSEGAQKELEALLGTCSPAVQARCKNGLGWLAYLNSDLPRALSLTHEALNELCYYGEIKGELWARNNLAAIYNTLGFSNKALALFIENNARSKACGNRLLEGGSLLNISMLHNSYEDYPAALQASQESLQILEESNDSYAKVLVRAQIISALLGLERHDEALNLSEELLRLPQPLPIISALVHYQRARVFRSQREFDTALEAACTGLRFVHTKLVEERLLLLSEKAQALEGLGNLKEAAKLLKEILKGSKQLQLEKNSTPVLEIAARVAEKRKRYKEALEYHKQLRASERARLARTNENQRILFSVELELDKARQETVKEQARSARLEEEVARDGMTKLYNHATLQKLLKKNLEKDSLALVLLDVDNFKQYNDTYGHVAGDTLLKELAQLMTAQLREGDLLARYGGEEFALLLPEHSEQAAVEIAERLREAVEVHAFPHNHITVSVGVASSFSLPPEPSALVEAADRALYQAKRLGKNRVIVAEAPSKLD